MKSTLKANDIILLHRASDRHRRSRRLLHRCGLAATGKRAMYVDNQYYELVRFYRVMPHSC